MTVRPWGAQRRGWGTEAPDEQPQPVVRPALAGLQMPLVEKGLPDLGRVSIEASTASRSPGLLPGRWPDAARPLTPLWFCYVDLRPHPRKGSLQGTPLPVAEPPRNQGLNLGWRLWASPPGARLQGVGMGRARTPGCPRAVLPSSCPGGRWTLLSPRWGGPPVLSEGQRQQPTLGCCGTAHRDLGLQTSSACFLAC